jgi:hypothetical protein
VVDAEMEFHSIRREDSRAQQTLLRPMPAGVDVAEAPLHFIKNQVVGRYPGQDLGIKQSLILAHRLVPVREIEPVSQRGWYVDVVRHLQRSAKCKCKGRERCK